MDIHMQLDWSDKLIWMNLNQWISKEKEMVIAKVSRNEQRLEWRAEISSKLKEQKRNAEQSEKKKKQNIKDTKNAIKMSARRMKQEIFIIEVIFGAISMGYLNWYCLTTRGKTFPVHHLSRIRHAVNCTFTLCHQQTVLCWAQPKWQQLETHTIPTIFKCNKMHLRCWCQWLN